MCDVAETGHVCTHEPQHGGAGAAAAAAAASADYRHTVTRLHVGAAADAVHVMISIMLISGQWG